MKKLTPEEELFLALGNPSAEEQAERVADLSDEEVAAELEAKGLDLAKVDEAALAHLDEMEQGGPEAVARERAKRDLVTEARKALAAPKPPGFMRRYSGVFVGAALATSLAAAVLGVLVSLDVVAVGRAHPPIMADRPTQLREAAFAECGKGHWESCLSGFDQAQGLDPTSDSQPEVQGARARAGAAMIGGQPDASMVIDDAAAPVVDAGRRVVAPEPVVGDGGGRKLPGR